MLFPEIMSISNESMTFLQEKYNWTPYLNPPKQIFLKDAY